MYCGELKNIHYDGYDPRGSGTDYYLGTCEKCGKLFKFTDSTGDSFRLGVTKRTYCGDPIEVYKRSKVQLELDISALTRKLKEVKQKIKELE